LGGVIFYGLEKEYSGSEIIDLTTKAIYNARSDER
jgi:hypothetical protein